MNQEYDMVEDFNKELKNNKSSSDVEGLDDFEDEQYIYVKHESSLETVKLNQNSYILSGLFSTIVESDSTILNDIECPIIIEIESLDEFKFVINYLKFYSDKSEELCSPEKPLINDIKSELELEYHLFKPIIEVDGKIDIHVVNTKLWQISKLMNLADYLDMTTLLEKLGAIVSYFLKSLDENELNTLDEL